MKVTAKESFGKFLTKGKQYEVERETETSYLTTDDTGDLSGWAKCRFESDENDTVTSQITFFGEFTPEQEIIIEQFKSDMINNAGMMQVTKNNVVYLV